MTLARFHRSTSSSPQRVTGAQVALTTKNTPRNTMSSAFRSAATVSRSIEVATDGIVAPRINTSGENCVILTLRHHLVAI